MSAKEPDAWGTIDQAVTDYQPSRVFALFSGGHDSLCSTHLAAQHPRFTAAVHINTGIGIEETRDFVRDTCRDQGWPLLELKTPPEEYRQQVLKFGFPAGPYQHSIMYRRLKERRVDELIRTHKTGKKDRILLIAGARKQESRRRMGTARRVQRQGLRVWVNPILDWSHTDKNDYMESNRLRRNPVVDNLHMSGECLCGAFASMPDSHELEQIAFWYPEVAEHIRELERQAFETGVWCNWGATRPENYTERGKAQPWLPLCQDCPSRWAVTPVLGD